MNDLWADPWAKARGYCPGCRCTQTLVRRDLQRAVEHICAEGHNWFKRENQMMHVHNVHPANLPAELAAVVDAPRRACDGGRTVPRR